MIHNIRVGILLVGAGWKGGVSYITSLVTAVASLPPDEQPRLFFIVNDEALEYYSEHASIIDSFSGTFYIGQNTGKARDVMGASVAIVHSITDLIPLIDFFYPTMYTAWSSICSACWIPDLQHAHLPQLFTPDQLTSRTNAISTISQEARLIVFSSKDAQNDFLGLYPRSSAITRLLPFHILPCEEWYRHDPRAVQQTYQLPDSFMICCNQFWKHKDHFSLIEAVYRLRQDSIDVHVVCTGSTSDYRAPDYFSHLQETIHSRGVEDLFHILGDIPRDDQIQLMRRALAVIQPSLFEGWSTVVEEARSLGKPIVLSDLPVNVEQGPSRGLFFKKNDPDDLARALRSVLTAEIPGADLVREADAAKETARLVESYGRAFCSLVVEAHFIYQKRIRGMSDALWKLLTKPIHEDEWNESNEMSGASMRSDAGGQKHSEVIDQCDCGRRFNVACPHCSTLICISHKGTWECCACGKQFAV
ncbi:MAG TPA: glycosyltransferase family 1 protein [Thermodesulfobacteriota bacterium]|nr:glycosyltransferase family 1 protein [Thermodesulfobacteriota bacterium]